MMKIVIVIPTYNERENISRLIPALQRACSAVPHEVHILVVDDDSPDGTADAVREEALRASNVSLITGRKEGLGSAYIRGMKHALIALGADTVMEMDADFSHKPEDVPRLLAELERGADFVIGSRYIRGGKLPADWGLKRRMNSLGGNIVARYVAGLSGVRDCTAGFRAIRTSILRRIDLDDLGVQGYAFQVVLLHKAIVNGARVAEIPVEFIDRVEGETKLRLSDVFEFLLVSWRIRFERSVTFLKFSLVGLSGLAVNLAVFTVLLWAGVHKFLASPLAIEISIITNFLLNNAWTFAHRRTTTTVMQKLTMFNVVSLVALAASYAAFLGLNVLLPQVAPQIPQALAVIPGTAVNYVFNSWWTFRGHRT